VGDEADGDVDAAVGGAVEQQQQREELEREHVLRDALVDEVPDERGRGGELVNIFSHINTFCTNIFTRMVNIFSHINKYILH
jgi:hypothetical protein